MIELGDERVPDVGVSSDREYYKFICSSKTRRHYKPKTRFSSEALPSADDDNGWHVIWKRDVIAQSTSRRLQFNVRSNNGEQSLVSVGYHLRDKTDDSQLRKICADTAASHLPTRDKDGALGSMFGLVSVATAPD